MAKNQLFSLLNTFSDATWKSFGLYIQSPFFNKQKNLSLLYQYLWECKKSKKPFFSNETAFKMLFPNKTFEDVRVRILYSNLHKKIENFIIHQKIESNITHYHPILLHEYRKLNLSKHFEKGHRNSLQLLEKEPYRDDHFYDTLTSFKYEYLHYDAANKRLEKLNFQEFSDSMDIAFFIKKLNHGCFAISHQRVSNIEYDLKLLEIIVKYIEENDLLKIPAIAVYYYTYQLLTNTTEDDYYPLWKNSLAENESIFSQEDLRRIYLYGLNYCIKSYNDGNDDFSIETFDMYKKALALGFLLEDGMITQFTYRNIAASGLIEKQYEWVEKFLYEYKNKLEKRYRQNTFEFNLGKLKYELKDYNDALESLLKVNYKDPLLNLSVKAVLIKIYYDTDEYDLLESHLQAMKVFIHRKKMINYHRQYYQNLVYFTQKLIEINPYVTEEKKALYKEIKDAKQLAEQNWLLKQLE